MGERTTRYPSPPPIGGEAAGNRALPTSAASSPARSPDGRWYWDGRSWRPAPGQAPAWTPPYRSAQWRAVLVIAVVTAVVAITVLATIPLVGLALAGVPLAVGMPLELDEPLRSILLPIAALNTILTILYLPALLGALAAWAYRSHRNLGALGSTGLRWSPPWAAAAWLIPIAQIVLPCLVMGELSARISDRGRVPVLVRLWFAAWVYLTCVTVLSLGPIRPPGMEDVVVGFAYAVPGFVGLVLTAVVVQLLTGLQDARARSLPPSPDAPADPPPLPGWARPYRPLAHRSAWALAAVSVAMLGALLMLAAVLAVVLTGETLNRAPQPLFGAWAAGYAIYAMGGLVAGPVAVAIWMHRAYRNLPALGARAPQWSPGWAAAGWFVPLANLVMPYRVACELWDGAAAPWWRRLPLLETWWATWLASLLLGLLSIALYAYGGYGRMIVVAGDLAGTIGDMALVVAGTLAILVIHTISRGQAARARQLG